MRIINKIVCIGLVILCSFSFFSCNNGNVTYSNELYDWPEEKYLPSFKVECADELDYIDLTDLTEDLGVFVSSLKAIVNTDKVQIYTRDRDLYWYDWARECGYTDADFNNYTDPYKLFEKYAELYEFNDVIICDTSEYSTFNVACTLAGIKPALIVSDSTYTKLRSLGYKFNVIADFRGMFSNSLEAYQYIYDNYWKTNLVNKRAIFGINPGIGGAMREYAIAINSACVYLDVRDGRQKELFELFLADMSAGHSAYAGWFDDEVGTVDILSDYGVAVWSMDYLGNAIFLSSQNTDRKLIERKKSSSLVLENDKVYIMLGVTDGDNVGSFCSQFLKKLYDYAQSERVKTGVEFPISWTVSPMLYDIAPTILKYYYDNAKVDLDDFYVTESGYGYSYLGQWPTERALIDYLKNTNTIMKLCDLDVINTWYDAGIWLHGFTDAEIEKYTACMTNCIAWFENYTYNERKLVNNLVWDVFTIQYSPSAGNFGGSCVDTWSFRVDNAFTMQERTGEAQFVSINGYCWDGEVMYKDMRGLYDYAKATYGDRAVFVTISQYADLLRQQLTAQ